VLLELCLLSSLAKAEPTPLPSGTFTRHTYIRKPRSQEWKKLKNTESWEFFRPTAEELLAQNKKIDFNSSKVFHQTRLSQEPEGWAADTKVTTLGEILSGPEGQSRFTLGETVVIEPRFKLEKLKTYLITREPTSMSVSSPGGSGYSYSYLGHLELLDLLEDGNWLGRITHARHTIKKGYFLVERPENRAGHPDWKSAPKTLVGKLVSDPALGGRQAAEAQQVYLDIGSENGVEPGMVFRAFQPQTGEPSSKYLKIADIAIFQTSKYLSSAWVMQTKQPLLPDTIFSGFEAEGEEKSLRNRPKTLSEKKISEQATEEALPSDT
jgi:hypothetical protein